MPNRAHQASAPSDSSDFEVTHKSVALIAVPMMFAYLSTPLVGLADTWAIGQLGDATLIGAVAVGSVLFDVLFSSMAFLRMGTTGLVAQAFGAKNNGEETAILFRALIVGLAIGVAALILNQGILSVGLGFIGGSTQVQAAAADYFEIRVLSAPIVFANYVILGYLLGRGQAIAGLVLQTVLNLCNVALNFWFVLGLSWGVAGVAWASVASETVALLAGLSFLALQLVRFRLPSRAQVFQRRAFVKMFSVNRDILIRSLALLFAYATFTRFSAQQGEVILAANVILQKLFLVASYFLDGLATAAEQLAGRALGARRKPAFVRAVKLCTLWSFLLAGAITALYVAFGAEYLTLMTQSEPVRMAGGTYLLLACLTPLIAVGAVVLDGVFIGATWSKDMRNMMLLSLGAYLASAFTLTPLHGNTGLWISLLIFLGMRGITLSLVLPGRIRAGFG
ncbi:MAG: MATE family efflux transporter [Pseudomonadota bacterium]